MKKLIAAVLLLMCGSVQAVQIHYEASGTVIDTGFDEYGLGDSWSVSLFIDFDAVDVFGGDTLGRYEGLSGTMTLNGNVIDVSTQPLNVSTVQVRDDVANVGLPVQDRLQWAVVAGASGDFGEIDGKQIHQFTLTLRTTDLSVITDNLLINTVNLGLDSFEPDQSGFYIILRNPGLGIIQILASIDSYSATVVPIPAAVWLFGSGLGLLGWMKRKATAQRALAFE